MSRLAFEQSKMPRRGLDGFPYFYDCVEYLLKKKADSRIRIHAVDVLPYGWCENANNPASKVILTNNYVAPGLIPENKLVVFPNSWYGMYAGLINVEQRRPSKNFNCLVNRMDPNRQSWLYLLIRRGLFDQGFISFNMDISRHLMLKEYPPGTTPMEVFENQYEKYCNIFSDEHRI